MLGEYSLGSLDGREVALVELAEICPLGCWGKLFASRCLTRNTLLQNSQGGKVLWKAAAGSCDLQETGIGEATLVIEPGPGEAACVWTAGARN